MDYENLPTPRSRVAIKHHLAAGVPWADALRSVGHEVVDWGNPAEVYLTDMEVSGPDYRPPIDRYVHSGATVFTYPHGVGVTKYYDGIDSGYERVNGMLVIAEGFADVYRVMNYPNELYVVGWAHCELAPFRATDNPRSVLFAPLHPLENGYLSDWQQEMNRDAYRALLTVPDIELTVRHLYAVESNGLWPEPGVTFVEGRPDNAVTDIDRADVVVSWGTFAHLAVARGAPTVFFGQDVHPSNREHADAEPRYAATWETWGPMARYPFDIADGPAAELLAAAARSEEPVKEWKRRFIGEPVDPERFSATIQVARARDQLPELRRLAVLADADEIASDPELLKTYAASVGPDDDATLVLLASNAAEVALVQDLQQAFTAAGLADDELPDMLLLTKTLTRWDLIALAGRAGAWLSRRPAPEVLAGVPPYAP